MLVSKTFEQTAVYDPNDPTQVIREVYAPGGYASYYFNRVADAGTLKGLGIGFSGLLTILFIGLKLTGVITWSWWWVLSPLWITAIIVLVILACVLCLLRLG